MSEMDSLGETPEETLSEEIPPEEISSETPDEDAVEDLQRLKSAEEPRWPEQVPIEADAADATDQERVVEQYGEEDYR
ncbi:hypothetical protein IMZ11_30065 [Microtetraspora sp. AC03309]|uniref:hypothetical protein n=1 Tax=Microtetraspora sp. AC03309 TaxID=2779376 RepID=UPI001E322600|nr:hypothetical protein [Microtetraspora sp. AC03309]MCC5579877.1 hypothetical protein [Microtetraspora sp. AC03309]